MGERQEAPGRLEVLRTFVNTRDIGADREDLTDADALREWLVGAGLADAGVQVRPSDVRRALALREAVRVILLSHNDDAPETADAIAALQAASVRARVQLEFDTDRGSCLVPLAAGVDGALGRLLVIVHEAMADGTWERLKACRDQGCEWAFYDGTRNRSRTWCDMQVCGNRAKARASRHRHGAAS